MLRLFTAKGEDFDRKSDAKNFAKANGGKVKLGPDHIGKHGHNRVTQHMRNKRKEILTDEEIMEAQA